MTWPRKVLRKFASQVQALWQENGRSKTNGLAFWIQLILSASVFLYNRIRGRLTCETEKGERTISRKRTAARKIYKVIAKANLYISVGGWGPAIIKLRNLLKMPSKGGGFRWAMGICIRVGPAFMVTITFHRFSFGVACAVACCWCGRIRVPYFGLKGAYIIAGTVEKGKTPGRRISTRLLADGRRLNMRMLCENV